MTEIKTKDEAIKAMEDALNTIPNTQLSGEFKDTYTLLSAVGKFERGENPPVIKLQGMCNPEGQY